MLQISCSGTPKEIGLQHGYHAKEQIRRSIQFYQAYFLSESSMEWASATAAAQKFIPMLQREWPDYIEEMQGIAEGAEVPFEDILALNTRTEISMGMMNEGCTSLSWKSGGDSFLAQNWDWEKPQSENLIALTITRTTKPTICQITEGGIIGKIGINSAGVGVCLNAIRVRGVDFTRLPVHLSLRALLDSTSRAQGVEALKKSGIASACHILGADATGGVGLEFSCADLAALEMRDGIVTHANHFLLPHHETVNKAVFLPDSLRRVRRIDYLVREGSEKPSVQVIEQILDDEDGFPTSINRSSSGESKLVTLFSIVMNLRMKEATVRMGRPTELLEKLVLRPLAVRDID